MDKEKYKMLAQRPPMGWNSWNTFGEAINEQVVRDTADAIVAKGLKDAGYEEVKLIDTANGMFMKKSEACWMGLSGSALLIGKK